MSAHTEQYRSGHNEHDWKSCDGDKPSESSNLSCSATASQATYRLRRFLHAYAFEIAASLIPLLRLFPKNAGIFGGPVSRTSYRSRRHFHAYALNAIAHSLRRSGFSPQSFALRGPLSQASYRLRRFLHAYAFEIAASLIPLLRLLPKNAGIFGGPCFADFVSFATAFSCLRTQCRLSLAPSLRLPPQVFPSCGGIIIRRMKLSGLIGIGGLIAVSSETQ